MSVQARQIMADKIAKPINIHENVTNYAASSARENVEIPKSQTTNQTQKYDSRFSTT